MKMRRPQPPPGHAHGSGEEGRPREQSRPSPRMSAGTPSDPPESGLDALADLRVLELGSMLAGPFCGTLLGEFGAEVIKVEKPGRGDALREWPPMKDGVALWWRSMSRNKRLVTLDLSRPGARDTALALIARADIVVENFRPGTLERWGYGPDALLDEIPHTVWVRVSGYGQTGPYAGRGGYATVAEAYSGLSSITGYPDRGPMVSPYPLGDYFAGTFAAFGALLALHHRRRSGRGQVVDVSLFEPFFRTLEAMVLRYDQLGEKKPRLGNQMEEDVPRNLYATADGGAIAISSGSQAIFENLLDAMGRADLKQDPRFGSAEQRVANRDAIDAIVADWMRSLPAQEAMRRLEEHRMVAGTVWEVDRILEDRHYAAREAIATLLDERLGRLRVPAPVPRMSRTPGRVRWGGGELGADNDHVYGGLLAMEASAIDALRAQGIV